MGGKTSKEPAETNSSSGLNNQADIIVDESTTIATSAPQQTSALTDSQHAEQEDQNRELAEQGARKAITILKGLISRRSSSSSEKKTLNKNVSLPQDLAKDFLKNPDNPTTRQYINELNVHDLELLQTEIEKERKEQQKERELFNKRVSLLRKKREELNSSSFSYEDAVYQYKFSENTSGDLKLVSNLDSPFANDIEVKNTNTLPLTAQELKAALGDDDGFGYNPFTKYYIVYETEKKGILHSINLFDFLVKYGVFDEVRNEATIIIIDDDKCPVKVTPSDISQPLADKIHEKMRNMQIDTYGFITEEQKNSLQPRFILSSANAIFTSMISVAAFSFNPTVAIFANFAAITGLVYNAHPKLATLFYQRNQNGTTPTDEERKVLYRDTNVLTLQAAATSLATTVILNSDFHSLCRWAEGPVCSVVALWTAAMPWYVHLAATLVIGFAVAGIVTAIAYTSQTKDNQYTNTQLLKVAALGFAAGALMYPAFLLSSISPQSSFVSSAFQYIITLGMMAGLSINIGDRLGENKQKAEASSGKTSTATDALVRFNTLKKLPTLHQLPPVSYNVTDMPEPKWLYDGTANV